MGQETVAAIDGGAAAYGVEAQCTHATEEPLPLGENIGAGRGCAAHLHMHVARVVKLVLESGMRFQPFAVRHVNDLRTDVVDRRCLAG
jgi:hypothetical protein